MENGINQLSGGHSTHWAMGTTYGEQVTWTLDFAFCKYSTWRLTKAKHYITHIMQAHW